MVRVIGVDAWLINASYAACVGTITLSQAWVLGRDAPRAPYYAVAWLASAGVLTSAYCFPLVRVAGLPLDVLAVIIVTGLAVSAAALWTGARRARVPPAEPFLGRVLAVLPVHAVVVLAGTVAGYVVFQFVLLRHIH